MPGKEGKVNSIVVTERGILTTEQQQQNGVLQLRIKVSGQIRNDTCKRMLGFSFTIIHNFSFLLLLSLPLKYTVYKVNINLIYFACMAMHFLVMGHFSRYYVPFDICSNDSRFTVHMVQLNDNLISNQLEHT